MPVSAYSGGGSVRRFSAVRHSDDGSAGENPNGYRRQLLAGKEEYYIRHKLEKQGLGKGGISAQTLKKYIRCCTPENIHGVCEDYRAAAGIDLEMDTRDFAAGRKIECPVLVIVGGQSHTSKFYSFEAAWSGYAANLVRCIALPCGHYPAEQDPDGTWRELNGFFGN